MAYATIDDLKNVLPEAELIKLADDNGTGTLDAAAQAIIQRALDDASEEIDGILDGQSTTLLTTTNLRRLTVDMAAFHLESRRAISDEGPIAVRRLKYENAIDFLRQLAEEAGIDQTAGTEIPAGVTADGRTPIFSDEALEKF